MRRWITRKDIALAMGVDRVSVYRNEVKLGFDKCRLKTGTRRIVYDRVKAELILKELGYEL